ncbi:vacuolar calcium ion transporter [Rhypophila sp. PSN 637]
MPGNLKMVPDTESPPLPESRRTAHRVFLIRQKRDWFNPFRHIPWDYTEENLIADPEAAGGSRGSHAGREYKKHTLWKWEFRFPKPARPFTIMNQIKRTLFTSWINVLLVCVPVGLGLHSLDQRSPATFALNYLAEIPLWFMCDYALEEIEKYLGPLASDLLDIFTTNTVQVISSLLLLFETNRVDLLQTSLVGGILSNILVLLGLSLLIGGLPNHEQRFNRLGAQGASTLLSIAATSILIPTAVKLLGQTTDANLVKQSRGVAVVLLFVYIAYTFCQMVTHRNEYYHAPPPHEMSIAQGLAATLPMATATGSAVTAPNVTPAAAPETVPPPLNSPNDPFQAPVWASRSSRHNKTSSSNSRARSHQHAESNMYRSAHPHEIKGPQLAFPVAVLVFAVSIVLLYFSIDATIDSIEALTEATNLTPTFVGLILLPIPNLDFAPISLAVDNYLEQTMRYTVGRSIQTALLVEPLVVLLAWWTGAGRGQVTLAFDGFEVVSLFTTILLLGFLMVDAKVHWVHGILLLSDWVLIGIAAYFVDKGAK